MGATHILNPAEREPVAAIKKITGEGVDYSLENTAQPKVFRQAVESLHRLGTCGLVGGAAMGTEATFDMNSNLFGRTIRGIIEGDRIPDIFIPQLIELYGRGRFPMDRLIKFYSLEQINQAVEDSLKGRAIKPVLRMPG